MNRALLSNQCWSCILKQSTGAGSRSSRSSSSSSSRSNSSSRRIMESVSGRRLYSSSSNSNSVSDETASRSRDSNYKSYQNSFPSSTSSKLKGKQKQTQLDQLSDEPDSQSSTPPSDSDWDLFSSDSFFNSEINHSDPKPSMDPPISSSSSPPSTQVSRQVLFSPDSNFYQNQFPSFSNQSQRAEILRRRRFEKERIGNHSNEMTSSGSSRKSNQYRAPLTEPEADRFRKVFDLINDQETVVDDDRRKLNGEIGNAIQLVEGLKGKGNGKLDLDFRNSSRFSKKDGNLKNEELDYLDRNLGGESQAKEEEIGQRFRSSDDDKEIKTKSVNETLDEILQNVRYSEASKSEGGKRNENSEASIGSHYLNPIAGNESLQGFRNRNRLNRFQNQIQRRRQLVAEEDQEVHEKSFSRSSGLSVEKDVQEATRRVEFEKNLAEIKDEIDSIKYLNQVWDWFSERVLRTSRENDGLDQDSSNQETSSTSTPCGIQTPYFSPILIHLFQTFKTKFNSPESSITLYEIVKSHSVESLIMSSSIPFFNLVLKTFWLDFKDYRECLKVLEVAQLVGVLDLERDPSLEREDDFNERGGEDEQQKFGDESIRETVELIRNEIRQEVLSKIELNKANSNKSQENSIPFNLRAESNPTHATSDPDPSLGFPIPTSLFKSIRSEFDFTSLESSEKLKVVHQMGLIVGKPFRVSSRISRDSSRPSTPSPKTNQFKSRELTQYEDEFREEKRKRLVEKLEERRLEKERKKDLGRKKNLAKVKVRSHSSRYSEKGMDSNQGGRWEKDEDLYQGGRW